MQVKTIIALLLLLSIVARPTAAKDWVYSVKPGDSLWAICEAYAYYDKCWLELGAYNGLADDQLLSIGAQIRMPVEWLEVPVIAAHVHYYTGDVQIFDDQNQIKQLSRELQIDVGDRLIVKEGQLNIRFSDGSTLKLSPHSEIVIDAVSAIKQTRQSSIEVSLPKGGATVQVPKSEPRNRFRVRTPSGVAAVRGTEFRVRNEAEQTQTRSEVVEGLVGYEAQSVSVDVAEGFGVLAEKGQPPSEPVQLLAAPDWVEQCEEPGVVEWHAVDNADYYLLEVYQPDAGGSQRIAEFDVRENYYRFESIEDGCYELTLKGVSQGFQGFDSYLDYCFEYHVPAPEIKSASLANGELALELFPLVNSNVVYVELSQESDFAGEVEKHTVEQESSTISVDEGKDYRYVRVQSEGRGENLSEYSEASEIAEDRPFALIWGVLAVIAVLVVL